MKKKETREYFGYVLGICKQPQGAFFIDQLVGAFAGCGWRWLPSGLPVEHPLVASGAASLLSDGHHHGRRRRCGCRCSRQQYDVAAAPAVVDERPTAGGRPRRQDGEEQQQAEEEAKPQLLLEETDSHQKQCKQMLLGRVGGEVGQSV